MNEADLLKHLSILDYFLHLHLQQRFSARPKDKLIAHDYALIISRLLTLLQRFSPTLPLDGCLEDRLEMAKLIGLCLFNSQCAEGNAIDEPCCVGHLRVGLQEARPLVEKLIPQLLPDLDRQLFAHAANWQEAKALKIAGMPSEGNWAVVKADLQRRHPWNDFARSLLNLLSRRYSQLTPPLITQMGSMADEQMTQIPNSNGLASSPRKQSLTAGLSSSPRKQSSSPLKQSPSRTTPQRSSPQRNASPAKQVQFSLPNTPTRLSRGSPSRSPITSPSKSILHKSPGKVENEAHLFAQFATQWAQDVTEAHQAIHQTSEQIQADWEKLYHQSPEDHDASEADGSSPLMMTQAPVDQKKRSRSIIDRHDSAQKIQWTMSSTDPAEQEEDQQQQHEESPAVSATTSAKKATARLLNPHPSDDIEPPSGSRRGRRFWSNSEINNLKAGYQRFGPRWATIAASYRFDDRTPVDLKDKHRNLVHKYGEDFFRN